MTQEQAERFGWHTAVHPDDVERLRRTWGTALATGEPFEYDVRLRRAVDGEYRSFHTQVVPQRDEQGELAKWYGVTTDIEERKRAEQERESSECWRPTWHT